MEAELITGLETGTDMKLLHISDLHIGKRVNEFSMLEDQKYILDRIIEIAKQEQADGVMIAGDIYDKSVPSAEAVQIFDRFLTGFARLGIKVFAVSGNHDSAERIAFGAQLMKGRGVYLSPVYDGNIEKITLSDEYGALNIYLLPFIKPAMVRHVLDREQKTAGSQFRSGREQAEGDSHAGGGREQAEEGGQLETGREQAEEGSQAGGGREQAEEGGQLETGREQAEGDGCSGSSRKAWQKSNLPESYQEAVKLAVERMKVDGTKRNVLVAHQFVTGAGRCESEEVVVGGLDNVDAEVFQAFDYVALGHIHSPQWVGRETVRYCGTPLKYSFSEAEQEKSVTVVELGEKGGVELRTIPLTPLHDMRKISGTYMEVTARSFYQDINREDYVQVTLTDEEDIPDGLKKLRIIYPNLMRLVYDNHRTRQNRELGAVQDMEQKSELELFGEFYAQQNNQSMSAEQTAFVRGLIEGIKVM